MTFLLGTDTCLVWLRGSSGVRQRLTAGGPESMLVQRRRAASVRQRSTCVARET